MRLAFSTLGVPGLPVAGAVGLAAGSGFHGIELRAHPEEPVHPGLNAEERADVVEQFKSAGTEILAAAGYARVAAPGEDAPVLAEIRSLVDLACDLGAPFVRVFPGGEIPETDGTAGGGAGGAAARARNDIRAVNDARAVRRLSAAAPYAAGRGVRILLETHDSHRTGADAERVLHAVGHDSVGVLWDVMHTWRGGEDPGLTYRHLAPYLGYVQVKDIASAEDTTPLPPGEGVLPLAEVTELLTRAGWDGWLCWEYEKRWYPHVPELGAALPSVRNHLLRLLSAAA